jgi:hypothetical protein
MEAQKRETNMAIYGDLTHHGVPPEIAMRFLITYRHKSLRSFARHIGVSHTALLKALKVDHKNIRELICNELFTGFNPWCEG